MCSQQTDCSMNCANWHWQCAVVALVFWLCWCVGMTTVAALCKNITAVLWQKCGRQHRQFESTHSASWCVHRTLLVCSLNIFVPLAAIGDGASSFMVRPFICACVITLQRLPCVSWMNGQCQCDVCQHRRRDCLSTWSSLTVAACCALSCDCDDFTPAIKSMSCLKWTCTNPMQLPDNRGASGAVVWWSSVFIVIISVNYTVNRKNTHQ